MYSVQYSTVLWGGEGEALFPPSCVRSRQAETFFGSRYPAPHFLSPLYRYPSPPISCSPLTFSACCPNLTNLLNQEERKIFRILQRKFSSLFFRYFDENLPNISGLVVAALRGGIDGRVGDAPARDTQRLHNLALGLLHALYRLGVDGDVAGLAAREPHLGPLLVAV